MPLGVVAMFIDAVLKSTALLAFAFMLALVLRRAPAAARHLVWSLGLVGVLLIPALSRTIPWKFEVLPAIESAELVEGPSPDPITSVDGGEVLGGDVAVARAGRTDQARIPLRGSNGAERAATATSKESPRLLTAQQLLYWTPMIWLFGVGVLSVRIAISVGAIRWMVWRGASAEPADWDRDLGVARSVLGLKRSVRLIVSDLASIPFTTGIWRTVIVLPPSSADWDGGRRRTVLLHELSHIKRQDALTHLVSQAACALYWFHPLAWIAAKRLRVECERACDDLVLNLGERPADYAEHLLSILRDATHRRTAALALPIARHSGLEERLSAILDFDGRLRPLSRRSAGMILASMVLTVVPLSALAPRRSLDADADAVAHVPATAFSHLSEVHAADPVLSGSLTDLSAPSDGVAQTSLAGEWILTVGTRPGDPSPDGRWVYRRSGGGVCLSLSTPMPYRITVTQDGQALTATGVTGENEPFELGGSVDETGVRFLWERRFPPPCDPVDFRFTGTVVENSMSGLLEVGDHLQSHWSATRVEGVVSPPTDATVQRRPDQDLVDQVRNDVEEAYARAEALAREQRDIQADMDRLGDAGGPGSLIGRRIFERKEAMMDELADLEREIDRLTSITRADRTGVSDRLSEAATTIQDDHLKERVHYSRGLIGIRDREYARAFEAETTRLFQELQEELQRAAQSQEGRISVRFEAMPIEDVLNAFSNFTGRSIVASANVTGFVTAEIRDQPWDVALGTILEDHGLIATEDEDGNISVDYADRPPAAASAASIGQVVEIQRQIIDWPVEGELIYRFGREARPNGIVLRREGIGIRAATGTAVRAVEAGTVAFSGTFEGYGRSVWLSHEGGFYTLYLYLEEIGVAQGREVAVGQVVGTVGGADTPEGPHIEFQIRAPADGGDPRAQDPLGWLPAQER